MKRVLITGAAGMTGRHMINYLLGFEDIVIGAFSRTHVEAQRVTSFVGDITSKDFVRGVCSDFQPTHVIHCAGMISLLQSIEDPWTTLDVNTVSLVNLCEVLKEKDVKILMISSSEVYAQSDTPIDESYPLYCATPYAISKRAAELFSHYYYDKFGIPIYVARSFRITGPDQGPFLACSQFAKNVAEIELGVDPIISVGDISVKRDYLDVRDAVRAYWLILERGAPGDIINVCSEIPLPLTEVINALRLHTHIQFETRTNPQFVRLNDPRVIVGNATKLKALGWHPSINICSDTIPELLAYWRKKLSVTLPLTKHP